MHPPRKKRRSHAAWEKLETECAREEKALAWETKFGNDPVGLEARRRNLGVEARRRNIALRRKTCTRKPLIGTCQERSSSKPSMTLPRSRQIVEEIQRHKCMCCMAENDYLFTTEKGSYPPCHGRIVRLNVSAEAVKVNITATVEHQKNNKFTHLIFSWTSTCQTLLARLSTFGGYQAICENLVCIKRISRLLLTKPK